MKSIPISSCKFCSPDEWTIIGRSKFGKIYKCNKCDKKTDLLLKRKEKKQDEIRR